MGRNGLKENDGFRKKERKNGFKREERVLLEKDWFVGEGRV